MNEQNLVFMGGSFNPPTMAHLKLMQTALDAVHAEQGFMAPVGFSYLKRKLVKLGQSHLCLPDALRLEMLEKMTAEDPRIQIDTENMDKVFSEDLVHMGRLQARYPNAHLFYVAGTDKLGLLDTFAAKSDFFDCFQVILFARDSSHVTEELDCHEHLAACRDAFVPVVPPEGVEGISSTKIREHLFDIDCVASMLHPAVAQLLRALKPEDYPREILAFKGEYAFLSNDFPAEVTYRGVTYSCVTSAFLAAQCDDPKERAKIAGMRPDKVRQRIPADPVWQRAHEDLMADLVKQKFNRHPELRARLLATGNMKLICGRSKDRYWGVNLTTWEGENRLGQILTEVRRTEGSLLKDPAE